jgi:hypothetical protein
VRANNDVDLVGLSSKKELEPAAVGQEVQTLLQIKGDESKKLSWLAFNLFLFFR